MEFLEDRTLLALAGNVFATFEGLLANPGDSRQIPISLNSTDFQPGGSKPVLGFHVLQSDGSALDPATVQITDASGNPVTPIYTKNNVRTGSTDSLTLAQLAMGNYTLAIGGEGSSAGGYNVEVYLAGDVDGNRTVSDADGKAIRETLGAQIGDSKYKVEADANLDGRITSNDYAQWRTNRNLSTDLNPLSVSAELSPSPVVLPDGTLVTGSSAGSAIVGTTNPSATVSLETGGDDNFDEGSTTALASGSYSLPVPLSAGFNFVQVRSTDAFGQQQFATLVVAVDVQAPVVTFSSPAQGLATNQNITIAGQVTDDLAGAGSLQAQVDNDALVDVSLDASGNFSLPTSLLLDGSTDGLHTVHFVATDRVGNVSGPFDFSFKLDTVPPTITAFDLSPGSQTGAPGGHTTDAGRVTLLGQTEPGAAVVLLGTSFTSLASGSGAFQFPDIPLAEGDNTLTAQATDAAGNTATFQLTVHRLPPSGEGDPVIQWNQNTLAAISLDASDPPTASRALAMVQSAVFDAVNAVEGRPGHFVTFSAPAGASAVAAVAQAAHDALVYLYPAQQANFDAELAATLSSVPDGQAEADGQTVGAAAASAIIALRANDGWND
jgi:hypothetical protein